MKHHFALLLTGALLGSAASAQGQVPAAGSAITNQAQITGNTFEGPFQSASNITHTTVLPVCGVSVTPNGRAAAPGQQLTVLPSEAVTLTYQVSNTGNQVSTFGLSIEQLPSSTASVGNLRIVPDTNGNGLADDQPNSSLSLNPGQTGTVFVLGNSGPTAGESLLNLVASCGTGLATDSDNVARVTVGQPPQFNLTKEFDRELLRPGDRTAVTITLENRGAGTSRELWLSDDLSEQLAGGLTLVPGSVRTSGARAEYSADGVTWQAQPTVPVRAIRVYQGQLAPAERLTLTFQLEASTQASGTFTNVARLSSSVAGGVSAQDSIRVSYSPAVRIGPAGRPSADGAADRQDRAFALASRPEDLCFDHTVRNTGDVTDTFTLSVTLAAGSATPSLPAPFSLAPGAERTVQVCYTNPQTGRLEATVVATGALGSSDPTTDAIGRIETALPVAEKSVSRLTDALKDGERVQKDEELLYTLHVRNPYAAALDNVSLVDTLPEGVELVEAVGASVNGRQLTWQVGTLPPGAERTYTVHVRVTATSDDEAITNVFKLVTSLFPEGVESTKATFYTWNSDPTITKVAQPAQATIGDRITYTITIRNTSETGVLQAVRLYDDPSAGLQYVSGSSHLNKQAIGDPQNAAPGQLVWELPDLGPKQSATLTYEMLVTPAAGANLRNVAVVLAKGAEGATDLASNKDAANTRIVLASFAPVADILGTVFVDTDGSKLQNSDEPGVPGARVILAGGRSAVTDERGRYHFSNVPFGTHAVRLDPSSVNRPADTVSLTQTEHIRGLTTLDFPLEPEQSRVGRALPLSLNGAQGQLLLWPSGGGYQAELRLTPERGGILSVTGALPAGATLTSGENQWTGSVQAGQSVRLSYTYRTSTSVEASLIQPLLKWKE